VTATEFLTLIYRVLPFTFLFELALAGLLLKWQIARRRGKEKREPDLVPERGRR